MLVGDEENWWRMLTEIKHVDVPHTWEQLEANFLEAYTSPMVYKGKMWEFLVLLQKGKGLAECISHFYHA